MYITIPKDIVNLVLKESEHALESFSGILLGERNDEEQLLQVWGVGYTNGNSLLSPGDVALGDQEAAESLVDTDGELSVCHSEYKPPTARVDHIGFIGRGTTNRINTHVDDPFIDILPADSDDYDETTNSTVEADESVYQLSETNLEDSSTIEVIHAKRDAKKRIDGLIDTDRLEDSHVVVVGIGTVGSTVAKELAKAGVGKLTLIDFDRLEIHNVVRHVCGVDDLGRKKTAALRDTLLNTNPKLSVQTADINVNKNEGTVGEFVADADVVAACADDEGSKLVLNYQCLKHETPAVYAGVYERGMGGDVIRVAAGETPCYDCVLGNVSDDLDRSERVSGEPDYSQPGNDQPDAEPGLSTDAGFISLIQTKFIMRELLSGDNYSDISHDMVFWGNREEYIFDKPLHSRFAAAEFRDDCRTCGGTGILGKGKSNSDRTDSVDSIESLDESPLSDN